VSYVLALDVGGTTIKGAAFTGDLQVAEVRTKTYVSRNEPQEILSNILSVIKQLSDRASEYGMLAGIGVGVPGIVNAREGIVYTAANLELKNMNLKQWIEERVHVPCVVQGDARVGALAEHTFGAGKRADSMLYVVIGTGVGSGIIINNQIYEGSHGLAGEIGHTIVDPAGRACTCGKRGCLETIVSARGIAESYQRLAKREGQDLSAEIIANRARDGDSIGQEVYIEAARALSLALANYCTIIDPSVIVIGGGLSLAGSVLFDPIRQYFPIYASPEVCQKAEIIPAMLGDRSGVMGASTLITEFTAPGLGAEGGGGASVRE
jgi:glucokinase